MVNMTSTCTVSRLVDHDAEEHARNALLQHPGIKEVRLDHKTNTIEIDYESTIITSIEVEHAVTRLGIIVEERKDKVNL